MRGDIQGLRGLAVLLVVAFHAGLPVGGGYLGVDVFFVISGFVITGVVLADLTGPGRALRVGRFYARRVMRLLPALALMLTFVALMGTLASPAAAQREGALTAAFSSVFAANAYLYEVGVGYFDVDAALNPLLHTWTLAVEEQFYIVFPLLLLVCWRVARRFGEVRARLVTALVVAAVATASFLLALAYSYGDLTAGVSDPARFAFYAPPTRAWEFALGAVLALLAPWARRVPAAGAVCAAGLVCIGVGVFAIDATARFPVAALLPTLGAAAVICAGIGGSSAVSRALSVRPLSWMGDVSYGWYLCHWPFVVFAAALWPGDAALVAGAVLALLPAWASYRYVEQPLREGSLAHARRVAPAAVLCVVVPLAAAGGLLATGRAMATTGAVERWERSRVTHVDGRRGCDVLGMARCTWTVPSPRGRIVLLGDSNAGQFAEPVVRVANRADYDVSIATRAHCPFVDLTGVVGTLDGERVCRAFYTHTLAELERRPPSLVVLASVTPWYLTTRDVALRGPNGRLVRRPADRATLWATALRSTVTRLNRAGIRVLIVHPVPEIRHAPDECAVVRVLLGRCVTSIGRRELDRQRERALRVESGVVADAAQASSLDLADDLCTATRCSTMRGGVWLYRDRYHLSVAGSLLLTARFEQAILRALEQNGEPLPVVRPGPGRDPSGSQA